MPRTVLHVGLIVAVTGVVYFTNLGASKLWDRDEPRNAGCAVEMLNRGDWVTPCFNGELRTHKPVLTYWLMMAAYAAFGVNEFAARFSSAVLGMGTALATYVIASRLFAPRVGLWAALAIGTSAMFCVASRAATPDASLIFCSVMAIAVYIVGTFRPRSEADDPHQPPATWAPGRYFPASWPLVALMYGWMGLGMLAKGPVGLILPTAVIGMFLLIMRLPPIEKDIVARQRPTHWNFLHWSLLAACVAGVIALDVMIGPMKTFAAVAGLLVACALWRQRSVAGRLLRPFQPRHFLATCWQMRPLTALAVALAIALPWYVWVGLRTDGAWLEGFFLKHNLGRATQTFEGHHGTLLFYPLSTMGGAFPWSILLVPAVIGVVARIRRRDAWLVGYIFAACWIGVYMGLFSLAKTKLPSYITPAYPALAMIIGAFVFHWQRGGEFVRRPWPRWSFGALAVVGVGICIGLPVAAHIFAPGDEWLGLIGLIPLVAGVCGIVFCETRRPALAATALAVCAAVLMTTAFGVASVRVSRHQRINQLLAAIRQSSEHPKLAGHAAHEPTWVFYSGQTIPVIGHGDIEEVGDFLCDPDAFVLTTDRALDRLQPHLPADVEPIARERFFLKKYDLVVLGRTRDGVRTARQRSGEAGNLR